MISVLVTASDDPKPLARLLTALVPAAAEGLVREVAVIGAAGPSLEVADDAGALLINAGGFAEALARARGPWLAGLPLTAVLTTDWMALVSAHLASGDASAARLTARGFALGGGGTQGWLAPKRAASAAAAEQDLHRLARRSGQTLRIFERR
jgi:hypothetical protein